MPRIKRFENGLKPGPWILLNFRLPRKLRDLEYLKEDLLFRDLFYCDLLLGSDLSVDKPDPRFKINRLRRITFCE